MQVAVFRYIGANEYKRMPDGWTWERQHKQFIEFVKAQSSVEAAKLYPPCEWTLCFEEVRK